MLGIKKAIPWTTLAIAAAALLSSILSWSLREPPIHSKRWKSSNSSVSESEFFRRLSHPAGQTADPELLPNEPLQRTFVTNWTKPQFAAYAAPIPRQSLALADEIRAKDFITQNTTSSSHPWSESRTNYTDSAAPANKDPFHFDRILVATVTKGTASRPGDRMMWTRMFVQPINFRFDGYTVAATDNVVTKITSIEATSTRKSSGIDLTVPGLKLPAATIDPGEERAVKSSTDITAQYERLGIDILPEFLRIIRESSIGGDVAGNTTVGLSIVTDPLTIQKRFPNDSKMSVRDDLMLLVTSSHLLEEDGKDLEATKASVTVVPQVQLPHCRLLARVWMMYQQREIESGFEFYDESQQTVQISRDVTKPVDVEIMSADDVAPFWFIRVIDPKSTEKHPGIPVLGAALQDGEFRELAFTDYGQASVLAGWVRRHAGMEINGRKFNYQTGTSLVPFKKRDDECDRGGKSTKAFAN
jgi:hypothetical protein